MITLIIFLTIIALLCWYKKIYSLVVFSAMWIISLLFVGYSDYRILMDKTKTYLWLMIICTILGILFANYINKRHIKLRINIKQYINWGKIKILLFICMLIFLYYFTITVIKAGGINLNMIRSLNSTESENSAFQGYGATLLFFMIAQPLFTSISIVLVYSIFHKIKVPKVIWIMFIASAILYLVTNAGRIFIIIILSFSFAGFLANKRIGVVSKINYKRGLIYLLGIFLVLNLMTRSRNSSSDETISFIQQAKDYVGCSIINMDYELKELKQEDRYNCGYYAYGGFLYYPIKLLDVVIRRNLGVPADDLYYLQQIKVIEYNGRSMMYNALVPNAFYFYFDSGIVGIIVFSLLSGLFIGKYEIQISSGEFFAFSMYCIGIYYLLFSPLGSQFWKTYMPMTIVWSLILSKKCINNKKYQ